MKDFNRGVVCALSIIVFGKVMYELGKRKDANTARYLEKITITKTESNKTES